MRSTKKLALSAMLVALGTVFMTLGSFVEVLDLTVCALTSLIVAFAYLEIGSPYTWLIWIATSLCTALLGGVLWMEYLLVFGVYPLLKAYIERLRHGLWIPLKIVYANLACLLLHLLSLLVIGQSIFAAESKLISGLIILAMNGAMLLYDYFITVLVRFYCDRLRHRFRKFLK